MHAWFRRIAFRLTLMSLRRTTKTRLPAASKLIGMSAPASTEAAPTAPAAAAAAAAPGAAAAATSPLPPLASCAGGGVGDGTGAAGRTAESRRE